MFIFEQTHRQNSLNARCAICRGCPVNLFVGHYPMTDNHSAIGKQQSQSQRGAMFWDTQNVHLNQNQAELLLAFAQSKGRLELPKIYYNPQHKNQVNDKNRLGKLGCPGVVVDSGENSLDKQLVFDCIKRVAMKPSLDIIILVLGDRDFAGLITVLKALGITVIVFARRKSASQKLINLVGEDNFHNVDELSSLCAGLKPSQLENPKKLSIEADKLSA
ncbi:NYN domain-containing protein [Microcoleus sp. S13_C5]|uniref:NYN domain-containing protein n=1 Tax=Microcoleus sp. S13_C5 TaxID=3055411 RepID=UPI002FD3C823